MTDYINIHSLCAEGVISYVRAYHIVTAATSVSVDRDHFTFKSAGVGEAVVLSTFLHAFLHPIIRHSFLQKQFGSYQ